MGAACCCCCRDDSFEQLDQRERPQRAASSPQSNAGLRSTAAPPGRVASSKCDVCGICLDPSLIDGHRESCRANHKKKLLDKGRDPPPPSVPHAERSVAEEMLCVVCMDRGKEFAFVPCGHLVACADCVKQLDQCPICRTKREALVHIDPLQHQAICLCKHCGHVINPSFFEGHREVCALQRRKGDTSSPPNQTKLNDLASADLPDEKVMCLQCAQQRRNTVLLPCGHRVLCQRCGTATSTCPVCCAPVASTIVTYDC